MTKASDRQRDNEGRFMPESEAELSEQVSMKVTTRTYTALRAVAQSMGKTPTEVARLLLNDGLEREIAERKLSPNGGGGS